MHRASWTGRRCGEAEAKRAIHAAVLGSSNVSVFLLARGDGDGDADGERRCQCQLSTAVRQQAFQDAGGRKKGENESWNPRPRQINSRGRECDRNTRVPNYRALAPQPGASLHPWALPLWARLGGSSGWEWVGRRGGGAFGWGRTRFPPRCTCGG